MTPLALSFLKDLLSPHAYSKDIRTYYEISKLDRKHLLKEGL
jgi:hypothetical protein